MYKKFATYLFLRWVVVGVISFLFFAESAGSIYSFQEDTLSLATDSLFLVQDTVPSDSLNMNQPRKREMLISPQKDMMTDDVVYSGDSIAVTGTSVVDIYGNAKVVFGEIDLAAYYIHMNLDSNTIHAKGRLDSIGRKTDLPIFTDHGTSYTQEELSYNFSTQKAFIRNVVTEQGEGYVTSEVTKKIDENAMCMQNGRYTTCDNHEHPHFYLRMTRAKVRPGKNIVTGPAYMVMEDVPIYPLFIPFGYFPFTKTYSSGFIMPSYGEENVKGFYLKDGGYYFALSDYMDLKLTGDIYSKGSWRLRGSSQYRLRYKFSGSLSLNYSVNSDKDKDDPDYSLAKDFKITWSHRQDSKASPYSSFSASVDFSTGKYEQNNYDTYYNPSVLATNHKSSSISYSKRFPTLPLSFTSSIMASQNSSNQTLSLTLPQMNLSVTRIYPFKSTSGVGKDRWYEKIGMSYSGSVSNKISGLEDEVLSGSPNAKWQNGMKHSIPVSTSFNLLNYITVSPSMSYTERWYLNSIDRYIDTETSELVTDTISGFNRVYDYSFSVGTSTKLYGFYRPSRKLFGDKVDAIRHVMTPSISYSYRPDFGQDKFGYYDYYENYIDGYDDPELVYYSRYEGSLYGTPGRGRSGSVSFSVGNNVEMKLKEVTDTAETFKKVKLIESLSMSTSYNIAADSMRWSIISVRGRTTLFKGLSINMGASFDPYVYGTDQYGRSSRINTTYWERDRSIAALTSANMSTGYAINNDTFKNLFGKGGDKKGSGSPKGEGPASDGARPEGGPDGSPEAKGPPDTESKKGAYATPSIPWTLSADFSYRISGTYNEDIDDYDYDGTSNLRFNGSIKLTDKWDIRASSGYDFKEKEITSTNFSISRNLHCWSMSMSVMPFGRYKNYNFSIRVNSSMLQDLKYEKRSTPSDNPGWEY